MTTEEERIKDEQQKQLRQEVYEKLEKTKQHLKFKNRITVHFYMRIAICVLSAITFLCFLFLPIFKIKTEFLGISLGSKNFSLYEACIAAKNAHDSDANIYNVGYTYYWTMLILLAFFVFSTLLHITLCILDLSPFNAEKRAQKHFAYAKACKRFQFNTDSWFNLFLLVVFILIFILIIPWLNKKYAYTPSEEFYTVSTNGSYLIYKFFNGDIFIVFQNYFDYCNGVSGYIAIPIIVLIIAIVARVVNGNNKRNLIKDITAEEIIMPEEITPEESAEASQNSQQ